MPIKKKKVAARKPRKHKPKHLWLIRLDYEYKMYYCAERPSPFKDCHGEWYHVEDHQVSEFLFCSELFNKFVPQFKLKKGQSGRFVTGPSSRSLYLKDIQ